MKAAVAHGDGHLTIEELDPPNIDEGEILVGVRSAALNRRDLLVRDGFYRFKGSCVPGSDAAGIRLDTGAEVVLYPGRNWGPSESFHGDQFETLGGPRDGTLAELVAVPAEGLRPKPSRLTWDQAAALPVAGLTAYRSLFTVGRLQAGESVLVLGAGSGVGAMAVSFAHAARADVFVTSSSSQKIARAAALGSKGGVTYDTERWVDAILEMTSGGVHLVVDPLGGFLQQAIRCLRSGGRIVTFGAARSAEAKINVRELYLGQKQILGTVLGSPTEFDAMLRMIERSDWAPCIDSVWALEDSDSALEALEAGKQFGKLVVRVSGGSGTPHEAPA